MWILLAALFFLPSLAILMASQDAPLESPIKQDEHVVFFPTLGRRAPGGEGWLLQIHGWIFEPESGDE